MLEKNQNIGQNLLWEEQEIIIHAPYNTPIKRFFDSENFDIKEFKQNGDKPIIIIRYKKED